MHRVWLRPCNRDHEDYTDSDAFMPSALAGAGAAPAYWLRGLPARDDAHPLFASLGGGRGWSWVGREWEDC
eukprot:5291288-Pyramimonas_sp.AAC.1